MPNSLAYLALLVWPLVVLVLFKRFSPQRALIWSLLGGYLLLPPASHAVIDFPAIPPLDKMSIPALASYVGAVFVAGQKVPLLPQNIWARLLLLGFVLTPFGTVLTNPQPLPIAANVILPGLQLYDAVSIIANQIFVIFTFAMARSLLANTAALREILIALVISGLIYSAPMLLEVRLSPQLNIWIYGFFQHSFEQMMRQGGFRPIVFLAHGLWVAFFAMTAVLAAFALAKEASEAKRQQLLIAGLYLLVVLVLCKSIGALLFALMGIPMIWLAPYRWQLKAALAMGLLAIIYPVLRAGGHIPAAALVDYVATHSAERAQSLGYRFDNEALLLSHAYQKFWFGWGGFERNLLHDPLTARVITIADGRWVITLGMFGWSGYIAEFGLLCLPLVLIWHKHRQRQAIIPPAVAALALMHGINMVDLLPNATLTPLTWMIAGALLGYAEGFVAQAEPAPPKARTLI